MWSSKVYIVLLLFPVIASSFYIPTQKPVDIRLEVNHMMKLLKLPMFDNQTLLSESTEAPTTPQPTEAPTTAKPLICKTWAQDTFDILGHFLDSVMQLTGDLEPCEDGQIVVSMWGDDAFVPELNKYGK
jgi:hypothetical protein